MKESFLLEGINGHFMIFSLAAIIWFTFYIIKNWHMGYQFLRPSLALWGIFMGECILRANFWVTRHLINMGYSVTASNMATIIGSTIASWAILCMIFILMPEKLRVRAIMVTIVIDAIFLYVTLNQIV